MMAKIEDVERLCLWLGIPAGYTRDHMPLLNWLVFEGHVHHEGMYGGFL